MEMANSGPKYRDEILKMMFVAGETRQPDVETTTMVENIVRDQTIHMLTVAGDLAAHRGQTKFTLDDIIFQVRNDAECLARLRNHMQWKQIRKRAKVKDDGSADDLDVDDVNDIIEDEGGDDDAEAPGATEPNPDPATHSKSDATAAIANGPVVSIPPLPWSILYMFPYAADIPSLATIDDDDGIGGEDPGPSSGSTTSHWFLACLMKNDERTRAMTAEEYSAWSDCRSASFTYRRKKAFREWCGLGVITDHRAKDDVLEILGFLTSEWVQKLTERALQVQQQEVRESAGVNGRTGSKRKYDDGPFSMRGGGGCEPKNTSDEPVTKSPIQIRHVRQAFEILQTPLKKYTAMLNGSQSRGRKKMRIF